VVVHTCNVSTQEAEAGELQVQGQPGLHSKIRLKERKRSWTPLAHACNPSCLGGWDQEDPVWRPTWANSSWDPHLQNNQTRGVAQAVELLLCKCEALSSNPSPTKKKRKEKRFYHLQIAAFWLRPLSFICVLFFSCLVVIAGTFRRIPAEKTKPDVLITKCGMPWVCADVLDPVGKLSCCMHFPGVVDIFVSVLVAVRLCSIDMMDLIDWLFCVLNQPMSNHSWSLGIALILICFGFALLTFYWKIL
jgi:hypothetical protein